MFGIRSICSSGKNEPLVKNHLFSFFLNSLIQTVGFSFIYLLSIYFIKAAIRNDYNINSSSNILNLKIYDKLTIRDALWLLQIQNKVKYDAIAINSKVSLEL